MGVPWALLTAIGLLIAFEAVLHALGPMRLIAYASDEGQYHAVRDTIEAQGAADVALVGSSQMREGVSMPVLLDEVKKRVGRPVWVANYAVRGARADVMNAVVRLLQRQPTPPKLIVVGLGPRDIRAPEPDWPRVAIFWNLADWWHAYRQDGPAVLGVLPDVLRNTAGRVLYTLRYREEIALTVKRPLAALGVDAEEEGNPILGELTLQHTGGRGERKVTSSSQSMKYLLTRAKASYLWDKPSKPPAALRDAARELIARFRPAPARGMVVEMPLVSNLRDELDKKGQTKQFETLMRQATGEAGVAYLPVDGRGLPLSADDFSDLQHLNRAGAERFATWLAGEIAGRLSGGAAAGTRGAATTQAR